MLLHEKQTRNTKRNYVKNLTEPIYRLHCNSQREALMIGCQLR